MLDPMFLLWTLRAREDEWSMLSAGSTFEAITRAQLDSLTLLVPSEDEQKAIAEQMSEQWQLLSSTKNLIATRHEQVAHLRVALLDAAFSGEI
jgi:type I restriction enzyme S subunit